MKLIVILLITLNLHVSSLTSSVEANKVYLGSNLAFSPNTKGGSKATHHSSSSTIKTTTVKAPAIVINTPKPELRTNTQTKYVSNVQVHHTYGGGYTYRRRSGHGNGSLFASFIIGVLCFIGSFYLICYNERRAVKSTQYIDILKGSNVREIPNGDINQVDKNTLGNTLYIVGGKLPLFKTYFRKSASSRKCLGPRFPKPTSKWNSRFINN